MFQTKRPLALNALGGLIVAGSMASISAVNAASLDVDVDIKLPDIIILYAYTDIDLTIAPGVLGPLLDTNAICTGDDCSVDLGAYLGINNYITALGTTLDLGLSAADITPGADPTLRLDNSWGVRGIGVGSYDETITALAGNEVSNLAIEDLGAPTMALQTGYVEFDIDASDPDPDADGFIEANYTITVTIL